MPERTRTSLRALSLGIFGKTEDPAEQDQPAYGTMANLAYAWQKWREGRLERDVTRSGMASWETHILALCADIWHGESVSRMNLRYLIRHLKSHRSWSIRLIFALTCSMVYMRRDDPQHAARALSEAIKAYRGFTHLCRREKVSPVPGLLQDYEEACRRVLLAFEPPMPPGADPVRSLARVARQFPNRPRSARPGRVIDALDALITAGHAGPDSEMARRVALDLTRMLRGRLLFHYADGRYHTLRPQSEHTLDTWTIHRLVRMDALRSFTVRPRPEFWQPKQRRPRALLVFPIADGVACIARDRKFDSRERRAVRAVLRFFKSKTSGEPTQPQVPVHRRRTASVPSLAGEGLIGVSRPWQSVLKQVARVAPADCPVVLLGETGTGKERLARAIHSASPRSQGPFVPVNCGSLAPEVLASELFGHIRGAFTGAHRSRQGLLLRANRGTLFLDELAEMPPSMQVALLRVLEDRRVIPVGSTRSRTIDVRVVCATHRDLRREVSIGRFREDLYHRLSVIDIRLPPLRDRGEDLPLLAAHLISKLVPTKRLHPDALATLARHSWPGNVRELDNVLQAAALVVDGHEVTPEVVASVLRGRLATRTVSSSCLSPRSQAVLTALGDSWLSSSELARRLGVSGRTINRDLRHLLEQGLVEAHGRARARVYRKAPRQ